MPGPEGAEWGREAEDLGVVRDSETLAQYGLRTEPHHLPTPEVYEAGIAVYAVTEGEVALEAVLPVSRLQTDAEIDRWEAEQTARAQRAARRGPRFGTTDPRDFQLDVERELPNENPDGVSIHGVKQRSSAEELAAAEQVLRRDNRTRANKRAA